jgi:segregation and condensation protein A
MVADEYKITLPLFEGPLELLLHLIKQNKIDIYDIPIAEITRQYLEYLELMKELNLEIAGEFLVMAATLIQIKTRMLLPIDEEIPPEEREDPRMELVERLLEYQAIKSASMDLEDRRQRWSNYFWREDATSEETETEELYLFDINVFDLLAAFKKVLENAPPEVVSLTRETLTVREKMNHILQRCEKDEILRFEDIFDRGVSRTELIVTFLALLELIRLRLVKVRQDGHMGQIWIIYNK